MYTINVVCLEIINPWVLDWFPPVRRHKLSTSAFCGLDLVFRTEPRIARYQWYVANSHTKRVKEFVSILNGVRHICGLYSYESYDMSRMLITWSSRLSNSGNGLMMYFFLSHSVWFKFPLGLGSLVTVNSLLEPRWVQGAFKSIHTIVWRYEWSWSFSQ